MWRGQTEAALLKHCQDFETLVTKLNQFQENINSQLKLVGTHVNTWGHHLQHQYGLYKAALGNTLYQVQNYVDDRVASIEVTPPAPPFEVPSDFEAKNPPPVEHMPDPYIALLTNQVDTLQGEIKYLRQHLSNPDNLSSESEGEGEAEVTSTPAHDNHGCCPGLEGQPQVNCACALDQLAEVTNDVADRQDACCECHHSPCFDFAFIGLFRGQVFFFCFCPSK
ncbi:hypothetical protein DSO57_1029417 [Entomophthora muscae]|uniref:Uncharacterized protein n=1 Tax=Entomophthora muscae TaxID=34485 RepID=A0ACC2SQP8_9FUNG|nr:hypothetical protein DSO57_1029417 [Entomophthora muscae]